MLRHFLASRWHTSRLQQHQYLPHSWCSKEGNLRIDFSSSEQRSPKYLAINPKGRVPAFVTGDGILTETPAILAFIAQSFPQAKLAPLDYPFAFARIYQCHVFTRPDFAMGVPHGGARRGPIAGGLHGGGAPHFAMGGLPGGGGPHGTPLRLGTRSRHGRRAPPGTPLHGGRQRQIRGSVPSHGARVLEVQIHLPPAKSQSLSRIRFRRSRNPALRAGVRGWLGDRVGRDELASRRGTGRVQATVATNIARGARNRPGAVGNLGVLSRN